MIVIDTETIPFRPGLRAPPIVCVQIGNADRAGIVHRTEPWARDVAELLKWQVCGHNFAYDAACMMATCPELIEPIFDAYDGDRVTDTEIRQRMLDIAADAEHFRPAKEGKPGYYRAADGSWKIATYRLDALAARLLNAEPMVGKGDIQLRYGEMWDIPVERWPSAFRDYAIADVTVTARVYAAQGEHATFVDLGRQVRSALWLNLVSTWGVELDMSAVRQLRAKLETERDSIIGDLRSFGLVDAKGTKKQDAVRARVFAAYAHREVPRTDGGNVSTDREACLNSGDDILLKYADYTSITTLLSVDPKKGLFNKAFSASPIHNAYTPIVGTGRTASRDPNIQNLPRKPGVRECLVPRRGCVFVEPDFSSLELCTLAETCYAWFGVSNLGDAINAGIDPHLVIAASILGIPYDQAKAIRKAGPQSDHMYANPKCACAYCRVDNARQCGKVANFGNPGGLGPDAMVYFAKQTYGVDLTRDFAVYLKELWLRFVPEMREFFARVGSMGEEIVQLYSGRVRGGTRYTSRCNTWFQGLGADQAKYAGWLICREQYDVRRQSVLLNSRTVVFAHDAYLVECPEEIVKPVAKRLETLMVESAALWTPHVKCRVETKAMRRYAKNPEGANVVHL